MFAKRESPAWEHLYLKKSLNELNKATQCAVKQMGLCKNGIYRSQSTIGSSSPIRGVLWECGNVRIQEHDPKRSLTPERNGNCCIKVTQSHRSVCVFSLELLAVIQHEGAGTPG